MRLLNCQMVWRSDIAKIKGSAETKSGEMCSTRSAARLTNATRRTRPRQHIILSLSPPPPSQFPHAAKAKLQFASFRQPLLATH